MLFRQNPFTTDPSTQTWRSGEKERMLYSQKGVVLEIKALCERVENHWERTWKGCGIASQGVL